LPHRERTHWHAACIMARTFTARRTMSVPFDASLPLPPDDPDALLLEGLFQLAFSGDTDGWEFRKIDEEVHARLLAAYAA